MKNKADKRYGNEPCEQMWEMCVKVWGEARVPVTWKHIRVPPYTEHTSISRVPPYTKHRHIKQTNKQSAPQPWQYTVSFQLCIINVQTHTWQLFLPITMFMTSTSH